MNKIWANRLIAGTQVWDSVPDYRKNGVKTELASWRPAWRTAKSTLTATRKSPANSTLSPNEPGRYH